MRKISVEEKWENLDKHVSDAGRKGKIHLIDIEGNVGEMEIDNFLSQPVEGILYDLNLLPESIIIDSLDNLKRHAYYLAIERLKELLETKDENK